MSYRTYNQDITYWAPTGESLYGADSVYAAPVHFKGRWEDRQEVARSLSGEEFVTTAVVFVPQAVEGKGVLALGTFTENAPVFGSHEIKGLVEVPDLRNVSTERRALL